MGVRSKRALTQWLAVVSVPKARRQPATLGGHDEGNVQRLRSDGGPGDLNGQGAAGGKVNRRDRRHNNAVLCWLDGDGSLCHVNRVGPGVEHLRCQRERQHGLQIGSTFTLPPQTKVHGPVHLRRWVRGAARLLDRHGHLRRRATRLATRRGLSRRGKVVPRAARPPREPPRSAPLMLDDARSLEPVESARSLRLAPSPPFPCHGRTVQMSIDSLHRPVNAVRSGWTDEIHPLLRRTMEGAATAAHRWRSVYFLPPTARVNREQQDRPGAGPRGDPFRR